jgi:hypothetical protein
MQHSNDNTNYENFDFKVTKERRENPLFPTRTNNFFFDVIKIFNKHLLPNTSDYKKYLVIQKSNLIYTRI